MKNHLRDAAYAAILIAALVATVIGGFAATARDIEQSEPAMVGDCYVVEGGTTLCPGDQR